MQGANNLNSEAAATYYYLFDNYERYKVGNTNQNIRLNNSNSNQVVFNSKGYLLNIDGTSYAGKNFYSTSSDLYARFAVVDANAASNAGINTDSHKKEASIMTYDGDKDIDVIFVENYISAVVESINYDAQYFVLGGSKTVNGQKGIRYDDSDEDLQIYFLDAQGNEIKPEQIEKDEVVSIFADLSGKLIFVKKGNGSITGVISTVSSDDVTYVTINGTEYAVEKGVSDEIRAGLSVEAFLNFENKVARLKDATDAVLYGAIVKTGKKGMGNTQVKMLLPGPIADESEAAEDPDDDVIISLAARNREIAVFTLADRVKYLDEKLPEDEVKSKIDAIVSSMKYYIVEYRLNSNCEISQIDVPEQIGTPFSKVYNSDERTFGATSGGAFGVCDETIALCVPSNDVESELDYMTKIKMSDGRSYYVESYEYNEDTYCADLIVIKEVMTYETTGNISTASKIGLVESIINKADNDGEFRTYITIVTDEGKTEKVVSEDTSSAFNFASLKSGDLICYSLDTLDRIDGAELLVHSSPLPPSRIDSKTYTVYSGNITDADYNIVSEPLNRWVDAINFTTEDGRQNRFEIRKVKFDLFLRYGYIAAAGDRHLAEFSPGDWYLKSPEHAVEKWGFGLTPVSWRWGELERLVNKGARLLSGEEKFELKPTGEEGVLQIRAILGLENLVTNVNIPNRGQIPNLPMGAVVETNAVFRANSVVPVMSGEVPESIYPLISRVCGGQRQLVDAALERDLEKAFRVFVNDPLVRIPLDKARELFRRMLDNTKEYLTMYNLEQN